MFPYKLCKFGAEADMSIYPECNAWHHLYAYNNNNNNNNNNQLYYRGLSLHLALI